MNTPLNRRRFLAAGATAATGLVVLNHARSVRGYQANERLNLALIGCGGRGTWFVDTIPKMANVVALCDVNSKKLSETFQRWQNGVKRFSVSPHSWEQKAAAEYQRLLETKPPTHRDFRVMLDKMGSTIDGVVIATPDHTHAVASAAAIRAGKHVFCEKPLTRTLHESRALRGLAREHGVATSMGNQGTASGPFRRALELIRDGTLGEIKEVHIWNTGGGANVQKPPEGQFDVPDYLDWDLWLGPASLRPYHPLWMRRHLWREFGTCQLGNWASHTANLAFMALKVHDLWLADAAAKQKPKIRVEAECFAINTLSFPRWEIVKWHIPAREDLPPITLNWYNGITTKAREAILPQLSDGPVTGEGIEKKKLEFAGAVFVGTKGRLHTTGHNATFRLLPADQFRDVETDRPLTVDRSRGHEMDWLLACRGGKRAWANFDYASALNEMLMLGNVATQFDSELEFDPLTMKVTNNAAADWLLSYEYRRDWTL